MKKKLFLILLFLALPFLSLAHPGRTDSSGCHTCRTNCGNWGLSYGEYHCHRSKGVVQPIEPVRSIRSNSGSGITVPAPEYKIPVNNIQKKEVNAVNTKKTLLQRFFSWLF